ncbi:hypothetical protein K9N68_07260 [Kovacikia minuta CCNUW1]|uniref:hypothetical protein n=1 Tax=Kovacikia minuta TaxID=2931930 RepID=UPI001CCF91E1|nr:hypothetical protein [Kovacikia minuta]UBF27706.1 hypothetical protein K9N68_07260 [Kovacikia minuta CCNUW1]
MIDKKFSKEAFESCGINSPEAKRLSEELAAEIAKEMHLAVEIALRQVVERLQQLGHKLIKEAPEYDDEYAAWSYSYRDIGKDQSLNDHRLRIHFDTQVCTGYPHYLKTQEDA